MFDSDTALKTTYILGGGEVLKIFFFCFNDPALPLAGDLLSSNLFSYRNDASIWSVLSAHWKVVEIVRLPIDVIITAVEHTYSRTFLRLFI